MLNITILGGGPSINNFKHEQLSAFCRNSFTIAINTAFKHFPHDMTMIQDFSFMRKEAEALSMDNSIKIFRKWNPLQDIFKNMSNVWLLDNAKSCRNLTGILAVDLCEQWLKEYDSSARIYLFGFDHKTNGHFHRPESLPGSACEIDGYFPTKDAPCLNMCLDSAIPFWPKSAELPQITPTTLQEKREFLSNALTWLVKNKYTTPQEARI